MTCVTSLIKVTAELARWTGLPDADKCRGKLRRELEVLEQRMTGWAQELIKVREQVEAAMKYIETAELAAAELAAVRQQARAEMKAECLAAINRCLGTTWDGEYPTFNIGVRMAINAIKSMRVELKQ